MVRCPNFKINISIVLLLYYYIRKTGIYLYCYLYSYMCIIYMYIISKYILSAHVTHWEIEASLHDDVAIEGAVTGRVRGVGVKEIAGRAFIGSQQATSFVDIGQLNQLDDNGFIYNEITARSCQFVVISSSRVE